MPKRHHAQVAIGVFWLLCTLFMFDFMFSERRPRGWDNFFIYLSVPIVFLIGAGWMIWKGLHPPPEN